MNVKVYERWKEEIGDQPLFKEEYEEFMEQVAEFAEKHEISVKSAMSILSDTEGTDTLRDHGQINDFLMAWEWRKIEVVENILKKFHVDTETVPDGFYCVMYSIEQDGAISSSDKRGGTCRSFLNFDPICRWIDAKVPNATRIDHYSHVKRFIFGGSVFELTVDVGQGTNYFLSKVNQESESEELIELP